MRNSLFLGWLVLTVVALACTTGGSANAQEAPRTRPLALRLAVCRREPETLSAGSLPSPKGAS